MDNVINAWKNNNVFLKQLELNLSELSDINRYPEHWRCFISLLASNKPNSVLDIGCGCGAIYKLCLTHFPTIKYVGIDYSEDAINLAKKTWKYDNFFVKNYLNLDKDYIFAFDLLHLGAMLDVLPNGDEALETILSLSPKTVLIGRMKLTNKDSYYETYTAYDEITTCAFYHNEEKFKKLCQKYGYTITNLSNNYYLKKT